MRTSHARVCARAPATPTTRPRTHHLSSPFSSWIDAQHTGLCKCAMHYSNQSKGEDQVVWSRILAPSGGGGKFKSNQVFTFKLSSVNNCWRECKKHRKLILHWFTTNFEAPCKAPISSAQWLIMSIKRSGSRYLSDWLTSRGKFWLIAQCVCMFIKQY